jgi:MFS family permease
MQLYWRLLRDNPEYAKLWFAQVISLLGDWFNTVVLSSMVARFSDGSGFAISIFLMLRVLPPLIVGPFAGVLLDSFNRKHLLIASNLLRAMIVPLYLLSTGAETLWIIYAVTTAQFALSAIFEPGQGAIIPALIKPDDIVEANTLINITWSVMLSVGAILGGIFAFMFGATSALLADAITFAFAGAILIWMNYEPEQGRKLQKAIAVEKVNEEDTSFMEGLRYIRRTPQIAAALFVKFGQSVGNIDTLLTIFATQLFLINGNSELSLGILYSALGLGALIGPIMINLVNDGSVKRMRRLIMLGFIFSLLSWPILGWAGSLITVAIAIFIRAMGGSINWTYSSIIIQKTAPDAKLGRMFSLDMVGFYFSTVVSTLAHGALVDWLGIEQLSWIIWGTLLVGSIPAIIWFLIVPKLEAMETKPANLAIAGD